MARKQKGKSKAKKKSKVTSKIIEHSDVNRAPHSFVFHRGLVGRNIRQLVIDTRKVMEPYTASSLRIHRKNVLKDFVSVAGPLGVTNILAFTRSETGINFKVARLPRGPTLTFKVKSYCLSKDVVSSLKRHSMYAEQFQHHPLLVLNNFAREGLHFKLMTTMFQNMFPSINVNKVQLNHIRRCVLFNYNADTNLIDFRHYSIKVVPVGMSKGVKKLIQTKIPNMGRYHDVSEYLLNPGYQSESEAEQDGPHNEVTLPQNVNSRGNIASQQSAVRLIEIGPRMTLQLLKIEEGLWDGEVLHHEFITKTEEEIAVIKKKKEKKRIIKANRRKQQEENVEKKKTLKQKHKEKSLGGMKKKMAEENDDDSEVEAPTASARHGDESSDDDMDDAEWFRKEVGEEPDSEFFPHKSTKPSLKRKRKNMENTKPKKMKTKQERTSMETKKKAQDSHKRKFGKVMAKKTGMSEKRQLPKKKGKTRN